MIQDNPLSHLLTFVAIAFISAGGCKNADPAARVRFGPAELVAQLDVAPSTAARGGDGSYVIGTDDGRLLLVESDGKRRWIVQPTASTTGSAPPASYDGPITALALSGDGHRLLASGGHRIAWWQLRPTVALLAELIGPQTITAAVLAPDDKSALFGTSQGHLLAWTLDEREASPLSHHSCGALPADRKRAGLPAARRCPYGSYVELPTGQGVCTYPLTQLVRHGTLIARACRTGAVTLFRFGKAPHRYAQAGALAALTFVGNKHLLFTRTDGQLRLYASEKGEIEQAFRQKGPKLAAASGDLLAIASTDQVRLWQLDGTLAGAVRLPAQPVWLSLRNKTLELLLSDGRLLRWLPSAAVAYLRERKLALPAG